MPSTHCHSQFWCLICSELTFSVPVHNSEVGNPEVCNPEKGNPESNNFDNDNDILIIRGKIGQSLRLVSAFASFLFQWLPHLYLPCHSPPYHHHDNNRLFPWNGSVFRFSIDFSAIFLRLNCLFPHCAKILSLPSLDLSVSGQSWR